MMRDEPATCPPAVTHGNPHPSFAPPPGLFTAWLAEPDLGVAVGCADGECWVQLQGARGPLWFAMAGSWDEARGWFERIRAAARVASEERQPWIKPLSFVELLPPDEGKGVLLTELVCPTHVLPRPAVH